MLQLLPFKFGNHGRSMLQPTNKLARTLMRVDTATEAYDVIGTPLALPK